MSKSKHSAEERARIIELYVSGGISQSEAARRAKVNHATIEDWANQYSTGTFWMPVAEKIFTIFHCPLDGMQFTLPFLLFL